MEHETGANHQFVPLTVSTHDYGDFEKIGFLGTELPRTDERITTSPGDIILYQGDQITVYYAENTWNFIRLGRVDDPSGLREALVGVNVERNTFEFIM